MISTSLDESELPLGSTLCLLCNGIVAYMGEERDRFYNHMKYQHGAYFNLEFIKAGCLMDDDEKTAVIGIMERKENSLEDEAGEEESNEKANEKLLTEEDYMEVVEENETKKSTKNVEESVSILTDNATAENSETLVVSNDEEIIKNDEKFIERVSEELKLTKDGEFDMNVNTEKEMPKETGSTTLPSNIKLRKLRIDIPFLKPNALKHLSSIKESDPTMKEANITVQYENNTSQVKNFILDNALPKVKETRRKVFTCDICSKEFPVNFHNLVRHKMKAHRISKKTAKVISMQHVRYETVYTEVSISSNDGDKVEPMETDKQIEDQEAEKSVIKEASNEPVVSCVLCNMAWTAKNLKSHLRNKHGVLSSNLSLFISGEEGLAQLEKDNSVNKNKCKICDIDHDNLGKLWNHYKRSHRVKKEIIKSLISKSKCTICAADVTFIGDHYRTFHKFDKENISHGLLKKEVVNEASDNLSKDNARKSGDGTLVEKNEVTGSDKEPHQLSEEELIAKLPSGSLTQFPKFFDEMKKHYPGKSEKEIKLKTIQMFKKVKLDIQGRESPVAGDIVNEVDPKTYNLSTVKEESVSIQDSVPNLKKSSLLESEQIKKEPQSDQTYTGIHKESKSYTCVICDMKVPHIWNHCKESHKMSKEEFKEAMQSFHQKNKTNAVNQNREIMNSNRASPGIKINTAVAQQILPELGLNESELSQELFIIDGKVGTGHLCNYCDFTCDKKENLNIHTQLKHADNIRKETGASEVVKMECEPCNLVLSNGEMEMHKKIVHSIFTCEDCETTFTNRKEFRNHTIMHMMDSEVPTLDLVMTTPETIEGQKSDEKSLKTNVPVSKNLKKEPEEEYFYCDDCDFSSNLEDDYRKHVQSNHVVEQPSKYSSIEHTPAFSQPLAPVSELTKRKNVAQPKSIILRKRILDEKTECPVCNRQVNHIEGHMKRNHPELEKIKDTPLYQEILADRSLAHNATSLREINVHKPIKNEFISTLKEKISKDIEPAENTELGAEKTSKELKGRVITINNTAMPLEECSLCHQKVLYLSQHIQDVHGTLKAIISLPDESAIRKDADIAKQIKKENTVEEDSGNGEYVANLINKLKDFDSEDEDDPAPSLDEQDVADTMDLIGDQNKIIGAESKGAREMEAKTELMLIDIDPKKLYDHGTSSAVPPSPATYESKSQTRSEEIGSAQPLKKNVLTLDHLAESLAKNIRNSKYFQEHPTVLKNCTEKNIKTYQEDPNLLPSWKVKFYPRPADGNKAARNDRVFLTPENMQIRSTFGVVEYMRCSGQYSDSQIKHVTTYLRTPNMKKYK